MDELHFASKTLIEKGWSADQKYRVTSADGTPYLLRISPVERYEARWALFQMLQEVAALDISMCRPVRFGTCAEGVYALHTWVDGQDAEEIIPLLTQHGQYRLGVTSGELLRRIHTVPAPYTQEDWYPRFSRKIDSKIRGYGECPLRFSGDRHMIQYILDHRPLLKDRPQSFQHGDYHIGNMMLSNGKLVIIDFDRFDFGDPWEEFNRITWCAQKSPAFAAGQLNGYFGGTPPQAFFELLALYIASNALSSLPWALPFGQKEVDVMMRQLQDILAWYDNMQNPIPSWYRDFQKEDR